MILLSWLGSFFHTRADVVGQKKQNTTKKKKMKKEKRRKEARTTISGKVKEQLCFDDRSSWTLFLSHIMSF